MQPILFSYLLATLDSLNENIVQIVGSCYCNLFKLELSAKYIYYMLLVYITEYACTKAFPEKNSVTGVGQVALTRCLSGFFCKLKDCKHGFVMACVQLKCQDMDTEV